MYKLFLILTILVSFVFSINAQKTKRTAIPTKVDLGKLNQNTYTNDFFELKIEFPLGWLVGDNMLEAQLMAIRSQMVKAKNPKDQAALNKAMNRVTPLLGGYKALPGSVAENSNLRVVVENLATTPKIMTDLNYLTSLRETLTFTKLPAGYTVSFIKNELINGKVMFYLETYYQNSHRRMYVIVKKGFAILLTIDAYNKAEFDELHQVLAESDLDYKK